jgi:hypothetical protein
VTVQAGVEVTSWWDADSLTALGNGPEGQSVVVVSVATGGVERSLFDANVLDGTVTNVIASVAGGATLVTVDDSKLFWWTPGMAKPSQLDPKMLTAAWLPDTVPAAPSGATVGFPPEVFTAVSGRPVRLDARDGRELQGFDQVQDVTGLATTPDGREALISHVATGGACGDRPAPVLERFDLGTGATTRLVGDGLAPVVSPNGRLVAYGTRCEGVGIGVTDLRTGANYRMDALPPRGRNAVVVDSAAPLAWSPDSTRILYRVRTLDARPRYFTTRFRFGQRQPTADYRDLEVGRSIVAATYLDDDTVALASADGSGSSVLRIPLGGGGPGVRVAPTMFDVPGRVDSLIADPSGTSFLVISDNVLYRWSPGDPEPVRLADSVHYAAWLGSSSGVAGRVERAAVSEGG